MKRFLESSELYEIKEKDIDDFSKVFAKAFKGYSLFEYFCGNQYDVRKMTTFWKVALRASYGKVYFVSDKLEASGGAVLFPPEYKDIGFLAYFKSGGYKLLGELGISNVFKMLQFDTFASKIKSKYMDDNTWYLYALAVLEEQRGNGIGSKILKSIFEYLDKENQNCYLETLKFENVEIYKHYGFKLMEKLKVPRSNMILYAMLREAQ